MFQGWSDEALAFYAGLEVDNSRAYWTSHKPVFDEAVHRPMEELLEELEPRFGAGRILRPYRDLRFSKDKRPYRTSLGAMVGAGYVQLSARGLAVGSGYYHFAPDQLDRYRRAVDAAASGERLAGVIDAIEEGDIEVLGTDPLKTAPRGYARDHPRADLLRYRGLIAWKQWPVEPWLATAEAKNRVVAVLERSASLREWLDAHVGRTTEAPRGRPRR